MRAIRVFAGFLGLLGAAWGVPSFQFSPVADYQTAYSTRVYWTSNAAATAIIKYGTTAGYGSQTDLGAGAGSGRLWMWNITALLPSTTYHYSVCLNDGVEFCSNDATFTTLAAGSPTPALPAVVDTSLPTQTGTVRTVLADCSNFAAVYAASTWGDVIEVPPGATCRGSNYSLPGKVHNPGDGWIVIRPTTWASLPAAGTRIQPSDEANMFTLTHIGAGVGDWRSGTVLQDTACEDGNPTGNIMLDWAHSVNSWSLLQCRPSATTKAISSVTYLTSNTATIGVNGHGATVNQTFWISGATSTTSKLAGLLNGGGVVTAVGDPNTITVRFFRSDGTAAGDTYTGSGLLQLNYYSLVPHTEGASNPVGACSDGSWYYNTTTAVDENTRATSMWYCGTDLTWHNFNNQKQQDPLLDLRTAKYIRIIGAVFTHLPPMTDPLLNRYGAHHSHVNRYTGMEAFVVESYQTSHVILDRCWIKGHDLARVNLAMNMHGDNVAFINGRISEWSWWVGTADPDKWVDTEAGGIFPQTGPGPGLIHNSYLEVGGITVHFDDSYAHNAPAANNYTLSGNTFFRPPKWFYAHGSSNGRKYFHRHLLEWKVGNTVLVVGNIFDGNWRTLNRGEAIILGFRSGGWYGTCTWSANAASCGKPHFLQNGDLVTLDESSIRTVTISDSSHFTLSGAAVPDGSHAVNKLNHDTSITDITVESNVIRNVPNVFGIFGVQDNRNMKGKVSGRVAFRNNLAYNVDQNRTDNAGGAGQGSMVLAYVGVEDVTVEHNTFVCAPGGLCLESLVGGIQVVDAATAKATGLFVRNNVLFTYESAYYADSNLGTNGLTLQYPNGYTYTKNVLFRAGVDPGLTPAGNWFHNSLVSGAMPFNTSNYYALTALYRASDTCVAVAGDCSTDGTDEGVNATTLAAALAAPAGPPVDPPPAEPAASKRYTRGKVFTRGKVRF